MPIYTPSYFPPAAQDGSIIGATSGLNSRGARRFLAGFSAGAGSTIDDLLIIGYQAFDTGCSDPDAVGTVVIGNHSLGAATSFRDGPDTVVGHSIAPVATNPMGANVLMGAYLLNALNTAGQEVRQNVWIGTRAGFSFVGPLGGFPCTQNVVIGYEAVYATGVRSSIDGCVILGAGAVRNLSGGNGPSAYLQNTVVIGRNAGMNLAGTPATDSTADVFIGESCATSVIDCGDNVFVGAGANTYNTGFQFGSTLLGRGTSSNGDNNVCVGIGSIANGALSVLIGARAGQSDAGTPLTAKLIIESWDGSGTRHCAMYGNMAAGNLILGKSTTGVDRDFAGANATNITKLLNGTPGTANPVGGGYFYVSAGALHWVGSAGTDTVIAPA